MDSEKPTRNGRASAAGSRWITEESFRMSAPPGTALADAARSAGDNAPIADASLPGTLLNRIERNTATPS